MDTWCAAADVLCSFEQLREKEKAFFAEMEAAVADGMDKAATEEGEEHLLKEIRLSERAVQVCGWWFLTVHVSVQRFTGGNSHPPSCSETRSR